MEQRLIPIIVFCLTFLAGFTILLGLVPGDLVASTKDYVPRDVQDFFADVDLKEYENYTSMKMNVSTNDVNFDLGGRNLRFVAYYSSGKIFLIHKYGIGLMWEEALDWYNKVNVLRIQYSGAYAYLPLGYLNEDYANDYQPYTAKCAGLGWGSAKFSMEVRFGFNTTLYDTPQEAWAESALYILFGMGMDQINTSINAWDLVGRLMTFQPIEVFGNSGDAMALNTLIAFPIMVAMVVAAVCIVLEIIPF